jgi:hypothetical protein
MRLDHRHRDGILAQRHDARRRRHGKDPQHQQHRQQRERAFSCRGNG